MLQRVGGLANQLDYKQAAALGSTFLTLGTPAEVAASATNAMVRELSIATVQGKSFMQGLDALGLSAEKVQKSMSVDAMGTIISVLEASQKLGDNQVATLTQIFGKEFGDDAQKLANKLPELRRQLELTQGVAAKGSMQKESDINKDSLSSQWQLTKTGTLNALSAAGETLRDPLMDIMLTVSKVVGSIRRWVEANPALVGSIMKVTAAIGALLVVVGGLMLSIGAVLGPMALVRLSFTTLAGEGGIARLTGGVMRLGGAFQWLAGSPMQSLLSAGRMVFGPLITLLAGISAPVWGLIALFAAAAVAVIKFWQPIQAFFSGFFTGLMAGLQPITQAFSAVFAPLAPLFDSIGNAISGVWEWFTKLLEPIQFSSEALAACTSAGETFGSVVGAAISALTLPIQAVANGLGWILEKLGAIPDAAKAAQQVAQQMTPQAVSNLADRVNAFSGDVQAVAKESKKAEEKKKTDGQKKQDNLINTLKGPANIAPKISSSLDKIATNTAEKKDGPGEIVFKNKQPYIPIRGGYSEPVKQTQRQLPSLTDWVTQQAGTLISSVTPWQVQKPAARVPVSASPSAASVAAMMPAPGGDVYNLNFDFSGQVLDEETVIRRVREELALAKQQADRRKRSQLTDHA